MNNFKNKSSRGVAQIIIVAVLVIGALIALFLFNNPKNLIQTGAWNCSKYTFNVAQDGTVTVLNASAYNEKAQTATVGIQGTGQATPTVTSLSVPALPAYGVTPTVLGKVIVPTTGVFKWGVQGSLDCKNQGEYTTPVATPTPTPTPVCTNYFSFDVK